MSTFNSSRFYSTELTDLYGVVSDTRDHFLSKGYEVNVEDSPFGSFISLSKGGIFKSILGMKLHAAFHSCTTMNENGCRMMPHMV